MTYASIRLDLKGLDNMEESCRGGVEARGGFIQIPDCRSLVYFVTQTYRL